MTPVVPLRAGPYRFEQKQGPNLLCPYKTYYVNWNFLTFCGKPRVNAEKATPCKKEKDKYKYFV